jgi:hypothetical protein
VASASPHCRCRQAFGPTPLETDLEYVSRTKLDLIWEGRRQDDEFVFPRIGSAYFHPNAFFTSRRFLCSHALDEPFLHRSSSHLHIHMALPGRASLKHPHVLPLPSLSPRSMSPECSLYCLPLALPVYFDTLTWILAACVAVMTIAPVYTSFQVASLSSESN